MTPDPVKVEPGSSAASSDKAFSYSEYLNDLLVSAKAAPAGAPIGVMGSTPIGAGAIASGFIGKDEFFGVFSFAFMMGHSGTGFKSLDISGSTSARPASDALYDICEETPSLHFLIKPGGKWMERAIAIGMFAVPIAKGVRDEVQERRKLAAPKKQVKQDAPAPGPKPLVNDGADLMKEFERAAK